MSNLNEADYDENLSAFAAIKLFKIYDRST